ncbi:MAG: Xaa-Pro peptidase family protein [Cyclobacteriaceae bacterium]
MLIRPAIAAITILISSSTFSQTPEQRYFEWTSLPFSKEELSLRRANLIDKLNSQGSSGLVLIPSRDGRSHGETYRELDDFYYFTGLELPNSILALDVADKSMVLYVPERDIRFESSSRPNDFPGRPLLNDSEISNKSGLTFENIKGLPAHLEKLSGHTTILLSSGNSGDIIYPSNDFVTSISPIQVLIRSLQKFDSGLEFQNIYSAVAELRMVKSPAEIETMRRATDINVSGIMTAAKAITPGKSERYLEGVLEGDYKINGAQRLAFGSIIKSGPNSLWPWRILATHYDRRNRSMETGDMVIFDVGCEYNYYVSDVGRTFPVSGKFTDRQKEVLEMEVQIADQIIDYIKPGITFYDLKKFVDSIIPAEAKQYMQAGLHFGHHLGLSTGDPNLPDAQLAPGMIFTVEPWYYNHDEGISVFTEDVILVTEDGNENLSANLPRYPGDIEKLMKE